MRVKYHSKKGELIVSLTKTDMEKNPYKGNYKLFFKKIVDYIIVHIRDKFIQANILDVERLPLLLKTQAIETEKHEVFICLSMLDAITKHNVLQKLYNEDTEYEISTDEVINTMEKSDKKEDDKEMLQENACSEDAFLGCSTEDEIAMPEHSEKAYGRYMFQTSYFSGLENIVRLLSEDTWSCLYKYHDSYYLEFKPQSMKEEAIACEYTCSLNTYVPEDALLIAGNAVEKLKKLC